MMQYEHIQLRPTWDIQEKGGGGRRGAGPVQTGGGVGGVHWQKPGAVSITLCNLLAFAANKSFEV
jgi:hypothetical protein